MRTFAFAYIVLIGLWLAGLTAGIGWSGIFLGMAMVLFPAHVVVRFIEGLTGKPFVQRRAFATAWGVVLAVVMIGLVIAAATKSTSSAGDAVAAISELALIAAASAIAALHLRVIWADRKRPDDGTSA
jgi:hypothetical protein